MDTNNDKTQISEKKKIWHPQQQIILKKWGEIGSSYRYLHDKAFMYYSKQNFRFALPVIILSSALLCHHLSLYPHHKRLRPDRG